MHEWPKMLYRPVKGDAPGDCVELGDTLCQTLVVEDAESAEVAGGEGFMLAETVLDGEPKPVTKEERAAAAEKPTRKKASKK